MKKYSNPLTVIIAIIVVAIIIAIISFASRSGLSPMAILPTTYELKNISLETSKSMSTEIDLNKSGITYFGISGAVLCGDDDAIARVFLYDDASHRYLVYSNEISAQNSLMRITGFAVANSTTKVSGCKVIGEQNSVLALVTGAATSTQSFRNECDQTCYLDPLKFKSNKYKVQIELTSGAVLKISKIIYR
jgi:HAMP domain-containing protein